MTNGQQELNAFFQTANLSLNTINTLTNIINEVIHTLLDGDDTAKMIQKELQNKNADFQFVERGDAKHIGSVLDKHGIANVVGYYKDKGVIVISHDDHERAQQLMDYIYSQKNFGLTDKETFDHYSHGKAKEIINLTELEVQDYIRRCEQYKVLVSIEGNQDQYRLRYSQRDEKIMERIKLEVSVDKKIINSTTLKKQIEYDNQNQCQLINELSNNKGKDGEPIEVGSVIVDTSGKTIEVLPKEYRITVGDNRYRIRKDKGKELTDEITSVISSMKSPVMLSKEDYKYYLKVQDKESHIMGVLKRNGRPQLLKSDIETIATIESHRAEIEDTLRKTSLDDPVIPPLAIDSVSIAFIAEEEQKFYKEIHEKAEEEPLDMNLFYEIKSQYDDIDDVKMKVPLKKELQFDNIVEEPEFNIDFDFDKYKDIDLSSQEFDDEYSFDYDHIDDDFDFNRLFEDDKIEL